MKLSTEQEEAEAAKAAETDASAMDKLMAETLDQQPQPEPEPESAPEPESQPPPPKPEEKPPEKPPEPAAPEPAAAEVKPKEPELDDFQKELASAKYDLPAGATRHTKELQKILKGHADERHRMYLGERTQREGLEKENQNLKAQLIQAAKDKEELDRFRPIVETLAIETNPNFNADFNRQIAQKETEVVQKLMACGLDEETAKYIMQNGGPAYFSKDSVSIVDAQNEDDEKAPPIRMTHRDFWEQRVVRNLSDDNKTSVRIAFDDEIRLKEGRDAMLRNALSNRQKYFADLQEQSKKNEEAFKAEVTKQLELQRKDLGDFAVEKPIPKDATPEQTKRIEGYNQIVRDAVANFEPLFFNTAPEALVKKGIGGVLLPAAKLAFAIKDEEIAYWKGKFEESDRKWKASKNAANTSQRQSVQQQAKPLTSPYEPNDAKRMEQLLENLPA